MKLSLQEIMLVYLLMKIDGEVSNEEMKRFDEILEKNQLKEKKNLIIESTNEIFVKEYPEKERIKSLVIETMKYTSSTDFLNKINGGMVAMGLTSFIASNIAYKINAKNLTWTMVNMAMADGVCSEEEKQLINVYTEKVQIENTFVEELFEIAKAMYSLEVHKEWLKRENKKPYGEIEPLMKEIEKNEQVLIHNLENCISY